MTKLVDLYEGSITNDETGWFMWFDKNDETGWFMWRRFDNKWRNWLIYVKVR